MGTTMQCALGVDHGTHMEQVTWFWHAAPHILNSFESLDLYAMPLISG